MAKQNLDKLNYSLNQVFKNLSISKINYTIDLWHLEFVRHFGEENYELEEINDIWLTGHEIEVVNEEEWIETIKNGPFDISDSVDYKESIKAMILFHLARMPIEGVEIKQNADLILRYSNNRYLKIVGVVENVDWVWWIDIGKEDKVVLSDFGEITAKENKLNELIKSKKAS
jgi:hypothetical protein